MNETSNGSGRRKGSITAQLIATVCDISTLVGERTMVDDLWLKVFSLVVDIFANDYRNSRENQRIPICILLPYVIAQGLIKIITINCAILYGIISISYLSRVDSIAFIVVLLVLLLFLLTSIIAVCMVFSLIRYNDEPPKATNKQ